MANESVGPEIPMPTPSEYRRQIRPEEYSDTEQFESSIDKDLLEYKLSVITNNNQEKQFEHLARKLAEKLICPNLVPQTGPTGGGDSKVDTENYPVHQEIALLWYEGNVEAAVSRWGFAISAKEKWQDKINSDIKSIASTGRDYEVVYFISSQFIRDKSRGEFQDKLSEKYGFDVRILDRSWLIEAIIDKGNEHIAAATLGLSSSQKKNIPGPKDYGKRQMLDQLEVQITEPGRYTGVEYQMVGDCLATSILSRELEQPRHLTSGLFERAERVANEHGTSKQTNDVTYQKIWTAVFWFDDLELLCKEYKTVEDFALQSSDYSDIEKLMNLWQVLTTTVHTDQVALDSEKLSEHTDALISKLTEMFSQNERPNNAANCKALLIIVQLLMSLTEGDDEYKLLVRRFSDLLCDSQHLGEHEHNN